MGPARMESLMRIPRRPLPLLALLFTGLLLPAAAPRPARAQSPGGGAASVPVTTEPVRVGLLPVEVLANGVVAS